MRVLKDFSVESDQTVLLSFGDGATSRVCPTELEKYLSGQDLEKVRRAIRLRHKFLRGILPPMLMTVLIVANAALLLYDTKQFTRILGERQKTAPITESDTKIMRGIWSQVPGTVPAAPNAAQKIPGTQPASIILPAPAAPTTPGRPEAVPGNGLGLQKNSPAGGKHEDQKAKTNEVKASPGNRGNPNNKPN